MFVVALPLVRLGHSLHGPQELTSVNALFTTVLNIQENDVSPWIPVFCDVITHRLPSLVPGKGLT